MYKIVVDTDKCTGCEQCVELCPESVLEVKDEKCVVARPDDCQGCMSCQETCEEQAITVTEE